VHSDVAQMVTFCVFYFKPAIHIDLFLKAGGLYLRGKCQLINTEMKSLESGHFVGTASGRQDVRNRLFLQ
jgi:hypothetical protein